MKHRKCSTFRTPNYETLKCLFNFSLSYDSLIFSWFFLSIIKEPLTLTRLENNTKPEKPKPLRRKTVADSFIAPLVDSKGTQHPANKGMKYYEQ